MTIKEYLLKHGDRIMFEKLNGTIKWTEEAIRVYEETGVLVDREYIRKKFLQVYKSPSIKELGLLTPPNVNSTSNSPFIYLSGKENKTDGSKSFDFTADRIPTEQEIIEHFNIDTKSFRINQIYHKTSFGGKYAITVSLLANKGQDAISLSDEFVEKLGKIEPLPSITIFNTSFDNSKPSACLVIPKQDAHWNAYDVKGENSIEDRFARFTKTLHVQLEKVSLTNQLEKIIYIVGSDEFNSEYSNTTTKGTPQQNILTYEQSFEKITEFNIETIKLLKSYGKEVQVVLLNGNHDHYVGWHLANVLKHVFKNHGTISVNDSTENTKIVNYKNNLILLNHGDASSPKELGAKFPVLAHSIWSNYTNYVVICGDKHHERSSDINGVICYQVPQLSKAVSAWSDKKGYLVSKSELLTFLFEEDELTNILRKQIK